MGNDGGSIPKRRELVREAARTLNTTQVKETQAEQQEYKWSTCQISQRPLQTPVVSDCAGNLYNKDAVLEFLLPSEDPAVEALKPDQEKILGGRVKGLRDVVEVKFSEEAGGEGVKGGGKAGGENAGGERRWVCPVTNKALGPAVKTAYVVPCGHAFAEAALREIKGEDTLCLQCNEPYSSDDITTILPTAEADKTRLKERMERLAEKGLTHALKKAPGSKKRKKQAEAKEGEAASNGVTHGASKQNGASRENVTTKGTPKAQAAPTEPHNGAAPSSGIKNAATASLTARVLAEEQEKAKRRKLDPNDNLKSLFSSKEKGLGDGKTRDFMTRGFSIPAAAKR